MATRAVLVARQAVMPSCRHAVGVSGFPAVVPRDEPLGELPALTIGGDKCRGALGRSSVAAGAGGLDNDRLGAREPVLPALVGELCLTPAGVAQQKPSGDARLAAEHAPRPMAEAFADPVEDAVVIDGAHYAAQSHAAAVAAGSAGVLDQAVLLDPKGVLLLDSLHRQVPGTEPARRDYPPIRFVRFTGSALTEGVERHRIESVDVPITDPARTIVDCFRYRTKVGLDVAMEGLREGLRGRRCKPDQLWRYARQMRIWSIMRPYVEAMVSDAA